MNKDLDNAKGFLPSPFAYRKGLRVVVDELIDSNKTSIAKYVSAYSRGIFSPTDFMILKYIYILGPVTRNSITRLIGGDCSKCKRALRKLRTRGLVCKNELWCDDEVKIIDYYTLSSVGYQICKITGKNAGLDFKNKLVSTAGTILNDISSAEDVLKNLALANFRAAIEMSYGDVISRTYNNYCVVEQKQQVKIPIMYNILGSNELLLIPVCCRRSRGWRRGLVNYLSLIITHIKKKFSTKQIVFVFVVEDNAMAGEVVDGLLDNGMRKDVLYLFASDIFANNDDILDNLVSISLKDTKKYSIVSLIA